MSYPLLTTGVDEAGRGALCGPVVAAAVILDPTKPIIGLKDSKQLSAKKRLHLYHEIIQNAIDYSIAESTPHEIDHINILQASLLAMQRAIEGLSQTPQLVLIDGNQAPQLSIPTQTIIQGDRLVESISAASILAKVYRDQLMMQLDIQFPKYGLAQHKGYPTASHRIALNRYGPDSIYRMSFKPVADSIRQLNTETSVLLNEG